MKIIPIQTGDLQIATDALFQTSWVGSGIILCLFDPKTKQGGISYSLFVSPAKKSPQIGLYLATSLSLLIDKMVFNGSKKEDLLAKICGGAQMLTAPPLLNWPEVYSEQIKDYLERNQITASGLDLGGHEARLVEFNCHTGLVFVNTPLGKSTL